MLPNDPRTPHHGHESAVDMLKKVLFHANQLKLEQQKLARIQETWAAEQFVQNQQIPQQTAHPAPIVPSNSMIPAPYAHIDYSNQQLNILLQNALHPQLENHPRQEEIEAYLRQKEVERNQLWLRNGINQYNRSDLEITMPTEKDLLYYFYQYKQKEVEKFKRMFPTIMTSQGPKILLPDAQFVETLDKWVRKPATKEELEAFRVYYVKCAKKEAQKRREWLLAALEKHFKAPKVQNCQQGLVIRAENVENHLKNMPKCTLNGKWLKENFHIEKEGIHSRLVPNDPHMPMPNRNIENKRSSSQFMAEFCKRNNVNLIVQSTQHDSRMIDRLVEKSTRRTSTEEEIAERREFYEKFVQKQAERKKELAMRKIERNFERNSRGEVFDETNYEKDVMEIVKSFMDKPKDMKIKGIIGMESVLEVLHKIIMLPIDNPEFFKGIRSPHQSCCLAGPSGTGKTMIARTIGADISGKFLSLSFRDFIKNYKDKSRDIMKLSFEIARFYAPTIVFLDDIDKIGWNDQNCFELQEELITQIDKMKKNKKIESQVFVIIATNEPWRLTEKLKRSIGKRIFVNLPDVDDRKLMIMDRMKDNTVAKDVSFQQLARQTEGFSNADIIELVRSASANMAERLDTFKLSADELSTKFKTTPIQMADFEYSLQSISPTNNTESVRKCKKWCESFGSS